MGIRKGRFVARWTQRHAGSWQSPPSSSLLSRPYSIDGLGDTALSSRSNWLGGEMRGHGYWLFPLSLVVVGVFASPVAASETATVSAYLQGNGSGLLIANSRSNPQGESWSWETCTLSECRAFAKGQSVSTGGAHPGTIFRARSSLGSTALSPLWRGRLTLLGKPSVSGQIRADAFVSPVLGRWKGGWAGDSDRVQLSACPTRRIAGCTILSNARHHRQCRGGAILLEEQFAGQFLRIADKRIGPTPTGVLSGTLIAREPAWRAERSTAVSIAGRIRPARGSNPQCGSPGTYAPAMGG